MLLSFARFEREVTAERIRDKIAAPKKKGMWMGGRPAAFHSSEEHFITCCRTRCIWAASFTRIRAIPDCTRPSSTKNCGNKLKRRSPQTATSGVPAKTRGSQASSPISSLMTKSKPDRSLVRLIVKARIYHEVVLGNRDRTMKDLVDEASVTRSYFTRAMRLAYLAPDIVRSIVDGTQPPGLTAAKLIAASRLPLDWPEQRSLLGFNGTE